jgi:hypothetical protein
MKKIFLTLTISSLFLGNAEAATRHKARTIKAVKKITEPLSEKFLQINLAQSGCEVMVETDDDSACFRRDHMRDEVYYHKTKVTIFQGKIFAEQYFQSAEKPTDRLFLKIKNGNYKIKTAAGNHIYFSVKDGAISKLKLLQGNLTKEKKAQSSCQITEAIYGFNQAYKDSELVVNPSLFVDEENFEGLLEFFTFYEKNNPAAIMVMSNQLNQTPTAIKDVMICQMPDKKNYNIRHFSDKECAKNYDEAAAECYKYKECIDHLIVKNCEALLIAE